MSRYPSCLSPYPSSQRVCNKHLTLLSVSEVPQCCNEGVICASSSPMPTDKPMDHATPTGKGWVAPLKRHARATTTTRWWSTLARVIAAVIESTGGQSRARSASRRASSPHQQQPAPEGTSQLHPRQTAESAQGAEGGARAPRRALHAPILQDTRYSHVL